METLIAPSPIKSILSEPSICNPSQPNSLQTSIAKRFERLQLLNRNPAAQLIEKETCRRDPLHWIENWVWTYNPKNSGTGTPAHIPFDLFPRQAELIRFFDARVEMREDGLVEKSREIGFTWLAGAYAVHKWLYVPGFKTNFGSRLSDLVDKIGDPDSIFEKLRMILHGLPLWMLPAGFNFGRHDNYMQIVNPENGNTIRGQVGEEMGRGGRASFFFIDEAAFLDHAERIEASTSANSDVRIWGSSVNGMDNFFARKRHGAQLRPDQVFRFHYSDDPRKTPEWAARERKRLEPHVWASEYDIDYTASAVGIALFKEERLLVEGRPVPYPMNCDGVFATIDTAVKTGKENDGTAITYWARTMQGRVNHPLIILDYDVLQIEGSLLEVWLPTVFQNLEVLAMKCRARNGSLGAWIEDKASGMVLLQHAQRKGLRAHAIDSKLTAMGKSERALSVSSYVYQGSVKISDHAFHKVVEYKAVTRNHLLSQVLGFRVGNKQQVDDDALDTFSYGIAIGLGGPDGF